VLKCAVLNEAQASDDSRGFLGKIWNEVEKAVLVDRAGGVVR